MSECSYEFSKYFPQSRVEVITVHASDSEVSSQHSESDGVDILDNCSSGTVYESFGTDISVVSFETESTASDESEMYRRIERNLKRSNGKLCFWTKADRAVKVEDEDVKSVVDEDEATPDDLFAPVAAPTRAWIEEESRRRGQDLPVCGLCCPLCWERGDSVHEAIVRPVPCCGGCCVHCWMHGDDGRSGIRRPQPGSRKRSRQADTRSPSPPSRPV
jgi:hypothetical protein